jgi:hypothetical protein
VEVRGVYVGLIVGVLKSSCESLRWEICEKKKADDDVDVEAYPKALIAYQQPHATKHPRSNMDDGLSRPPL